VATSSADGTTRVWDAASGRLLSVQTSHGGVAVNSVEFTRDSRMLVTAGDDWNVRLTRCSTCAGLRTLMDLAEDRTFLSKPEQRRYLASTTG